MNHKIILIQHKSGRIEWIPYCVAAIQKIINIQQTIDFMLIVPMGPTDVTNIPTNANILIIDYQSGKKEWMPIDITTINFIVQSFDYIDAITVISGAI